MSKRQIKKGTFSTRQKTSFQDSFRMDQLDKLTSRKSTLSQRDKNLLNASTALDPSRGSFNKSGRFFDKNARINNINNRSSNASGFDGNLNQALNQSTSISIAGFTENKSPTGVMSQKDVSAGITGFVGKLKETGNINSVNVQKQGEKITGLGVLRDFQKADFKFNPTKLSFETKGWDLDIPDTYIKAGDNKYIAPTVQYISDYRYKKRDGDKDKDIRQASYNPVEVYLNDTGDKLARVLKRDVYTKRDQYERDEDSSDRRYEKDVFTSEIQDYFGTGLMKQQKIWDDYTIREEKERDDRKREEEEIRGIYLKQQKDFNEGGYLTTDKVWKPYTSREEDERVGDRRRQEEEQKIMLKQENFYDGLGRRQSVFGYDDYRSDADVDAKRDFINAQTKERLSNREKRDLINRYNAGQTTPEEINNLNFVDGAEVEEEYSTALRTITYYDPITGESVQNVRYW